RPRLAMDLQGPVDQIHDPELGDAVFGVERPLDLAVVFEGSVRDLDDEENVRGPGLAVEVPPFQDDVRFRFAVGEANWILDTYRGLVADGQDQKPIESIHAGDVGVSNGHFGNDLPADELDPRILFQNALIDHPVVLGDCEPVRCAPDSHGSSRPRFGPDYIPILPPHSATHHRDTETTEKRFRSTS